MRKLTNEQLEKLFEKVGGYVDYWWLYKNDEWAFDALFENMIDAVRAAQYGDYDYTKPYFKVNDNDGGLYSMSEDEYFKELREGKDDLLQIYDKLVKDGDIEDFLNLSEDERELTDDQLMEVFEAVGPFREIIGVTTNDEDGFESLFKNGLEVARAVKYGDYDFTEPYIYLGNDGNLYSMDEDEFLAMLKDNKDELMEAYDDLVSDGCIEDFLNEED